MSVPQNGPATTWASSRTRIPSRGRRVSVMSMSPSGSSWAASGLQHFGAGRGLQLAGVHGHGQHRVVADAARQLDEPALAEAAAQRLEGGLIHAVLAEQPARELDDLRVFGGDA